MSMHARVAIPLLISLSLFLSGERGLGQEIQPGTGTPTVQVSVRNNSPLPAGCAPEQVVELLTRFLDAFNRGDEIALPRFFPAEGVYPHADQRGFQWYSVTDEYGHFVTYDPAELPAYFAERHRQHESLRLLELEVAASWHPGVAIVFRLRRQANDLSPYEAGGKGAVSCDDQTIFVWSMGYAPDSAP